MIIKNKLVTWLITKYMLWKMSRYFKKHPEELERLLTNVTLDMIKQLNEREKYIKRTVDISIIMN